MTTLHDLGPGFHLVPIRDHDRVSTAKWSVRVVIFGEVSERREYHYGDFTWSRLVTRRCVDLARVLHFEDYAAARRFQRRVVAEGHYDRATIRPPRQARRRPPCPRLTASCDVMALQATAILRGVLADVREAV